MTITRAVFLINVTAALVGSCVLLPADTAEHPTGVETRQTATSVIAPFPSTTLRSASSAATLDTPPAEGGLQTVQLTYIALTPQGELGVFAVALGCPKDSPPCIGQPILLFTSAALDTISPPSWSGAGEMVVFASHVNYPGPNLVLSTAVGAGQKTLTANAPSGYLPSWSPVDDSIAYTHCEGGNCSIYSIDTDGRESFPLLAAAQVRDPINASWSHDGQVLAFSARPLDDGGVSQIFVSHPDGSGLRQITTGNSDSTSPSWSPSGLEIVYLSTTLPDGNGQQRAYIASLSGGLRTVAPELPGLMAAPSWSPLGDWIAFNYFDVEAGHDIFLIRSDGSELTRITHTPEIIETGAAWRGIQ